jgi:hypothetical protein
MSICWISLTCSKAGLFIKNKSQFIYLKKCFLQYSCYKERERKIFLFWTLLINGEILVRRSITIRAPYFRVFLDSTVISLLGATFTALYETRNFISTFMRARY